MSTCLQALGKKSSFGGILGFLILIACGTKETGDGDGTAASGGAMDVASGGSGAVDNSGGAPSGGSDASGGAAASGGATDGSGGDAAAEACHAPSDAGDLITRLPCLLSETGLYAADMTTLGENVHPFQPQFPLWTDGAAKKRWISLPPGETIDTTDMDFWSFPAGTKLWKEFERDGVRVETRLIQKQTTGAWQMVAYQWRDDQKEADAVPNGVQNASNTEHDIPNSDACITCHGQQPDKVLGFSAIQLSHEPQDANNANEWTLTRLIEGSHLSAAPTQAFVVPGTDVEKGFFGYVHGNCGHCHNAKGSAAGQTGLDLWLKVADLDGPVSDFSVYKGIVDVDIVWLDGAPPATKRVLPGSPQQSAIYQRFSTKTESYSMPPLGTEITDPDGKAKMEEWITSLD